MRKVQTPWGYRPCWGQGSLAPLALRGLGASLFHNLNAHIMSLSEPHLPHIARAAAHPCKARGRATVSHTNHINHSLSHHYVREAEAVFIQDASRGRIHCGRRMVMCASRRPARLCLSLRSGRAPEARAAPSPSPSPLPLPPHISPSARVTRVSLLRDVSPRQRAKGMARAVRCRKGAARLPPPPPVESQWAAVPPVRDRHCVPLYWTAMSASSGVTNSSASSVL